MAFRPVDFFLYLLLRAAVAAVDRMSVHRAYAFGRGVGRIGWALLGPRRRTAVGNVLAAGITEDPDEARRIAEKSFESFALLFIETLKAQKLVTPETLERHVELRIPDKTRAMLADESRSMIYLCAHLGNWELGGHVASFFKPVSAIARTMDNPYAQRFFEKRSTRSRMKIVPKHTSRFTDLTGPLRSGRMLAVLPDQHARTNCIRVPFLGRECSTTVSPARLHLMTKAPVLFGICVRTGEMKFRLESTEPIEFPPPTGDRDADIRAMTVKINEVIADAVRRYPEQYFWCHRRWR